MEKLGLLEWCIIGVVILVKLGIIFALVSWSKSNKKKKKQMFLDEQERLKSEKL